MFITYRCVIGVVMRQRFPVLLAILMVVFSRSPQAQSQSPLPQPVDTIEWVPIGDMLVPKESLPVRVGQSTPQGSVSYRPELSNPFAWPLGIVPIAFGSEVSPERQALIWGACESWKQAGPIVCIPRTVESQYVLVRSTGSDRCGASVGAFAPSSFNFSLDWCWNSSSVTHDFGHILGFIHEHQRPDRDRYVTVDLSNVEPSYVGAYTVVTSPVFSTSTYDFDSLMHYPPNSYNIDFTRPVIVARPEFAEAARRMGQATRPSGNDLVLAKVFYQTQLKTYGFNRATLPVQTRFDRGDLLGALYQLNAIYISTLGLNRPNGLSLDGRPDFLGIASWIFDLYLGARSSGFDRASAFDVVVASITQTDEWRLKHPGERGLTAAPFTPYLKFSRDEFLDALTRLDTFYASREGLQRPNGLSINGAPDFVGIATWIFDIYLNQRLTGGSPNAAWVAVENAIKATDEWKSKH